MAASYPSSIKSFTTKATDDTIQPADVNDLQDEVNAIESGLPKVLALDADSELDYFNGGDEHGILRPSRASTRVPAIGRMLWLIPGHCDPTVNLYDRLYACRGEKVESIWPVVARREWTRG